MPVNLNHIENRLWEADDELRANSKLKSAEYMVPVLGLIFLRFAELVTLAQDLSQEEQRGIAEQLSEEELALFDLLTRPEVKLNRKEKEEVKQIARELLDSLKAERPVLEWRKKQQTRAAVQLKIEEVLDRLPEIYDADLYRTKCQLVYRHVYDSYYGYGKSIYSKMN